MLRVGLTFLAGLNESEWELKTQAVPTAEKLARDQENRDWYPGSDLWLWLFLLSFVFPNHGTMFSNYSWLLSVRNLTVVLTDAETFNTSRSCSNCLVSLESFGRGTYRQIMSTLPANQPQMSSNTAVVQMSWHRREQQVSANGGNTGLKVWIPYKSSSISLNIRAALCTERFASQWVTVWLVLVPV